MYKGESHLDKIHIHSPDLKCLVKMMTQEESLAGFLDYGRNSKKSLTLATERSQKIPKFKLIIAL